MDPKEILFPQDLLHQSGDFQLLCTHLARYIVQRWQCCKCILVFRGISAIEWYTSVPWLTCHIGVDDLQGIPHKSDSSIYQWHQKYQWTEEEASLLISAWAINYILLQSNEMINRWQANVHISGCYDFWVNTAGYKFLIIPKVAKESFANDSCLKTGQNVNNFIFSSD